ncbi:hypothetical protein, partial [Acidovorax sp. HMWF018]|uniref:hypothetical protein n=1 Tax=Acidovorax sp. HMWF018 TaxID=2056855 RepID=UPI001E2F8E5B
MVFLSQVGSVLLSFLSRRRGWLIEDRLFESTPEATTQCSPQCAHTGRTNLPVPEEKLTPPRTGRRDNPPTPL